MGLRRGAWRDDGSLASRALRRVRASPPARDPGRRARPAGASWPCRRGLPACCSPAVSRAGTRSARLTRRPLARGSVLLRSSGQRKTVAVVPKRPDTVRVPDYLASGHLAQRRAIAFQVPLALNKILIHPDHHCKIRKSNLRSERFYFLHLNILCDWVALKGIYRCIS